MITFNNKEIKQLLKGSDTTINELNNFIQEKSDRKYTIVKKKMVQDINERLLDNILCIDKLNQYFFNNWKEIIKTNQDVTDKWKDELKEFKD